MIKEIIKNSRIIPDALRRTNHIHFTIDHTQEFADGFRIILG